MVFVTFTLANEICRSASALFLAVVLIPKNLVRMPSLRSSETSRFAPRRFSAKTLVSKRSAKQTEMRTAEILLRSSDHFDPQTAIAFKRIVNNSLFCRRDLCDRSDMLSYRQTIGGSADCSRGDNEV